MVTRTGGFKRKTRHKLSKNIRQKGKVSLKKYFQEFETGERCVLKCEPAVQKGMYFPRFHGKSGIVKSKRGACYEVTIKDGKLEKTIIVHPVHLLKN
ncbi:50S ribosomal protein L21e [Candidatus Woesearchaeota archaeon]|nr:MAG: 50S ribosomal protein L21e [Candidatus Woesearchaeota archaeon]